MPQPVSIRSSATPSPCRQVRTTSCPPSGIACWALSTRFSSAPWNASRSSSTRGQVAGEVVDDLDAGLRRLGAEEVEHLRDLRRSGRSARRFSRADLGEVQEVVQQVLQPLALPLDHLRPCASARRSRGDSASAKSSASSSMFRRIVESGFLISCASPPASRGDLRVLVDQLLVDVARRVGRIGHVHGGRR